MAKSLFFCPALAAHFRIPAPAGDCLELTAPVADSRARLFVLATDNLKKLGDLIPQVSLFIYSSRFRFRGIRFRSGEFNPGEHPSIGPSSTGYQWPLR